MERQYIEYLESNLSKIVTNIPNIDRIKQFVRDGVDLNLYFIYNKYGGRGYEHTLPGQTLLFGLVRIIPMYSGTKSRLKRITDLMEYSLENGADVNIGFAKISERSRKPKGSILSPLTFAVYNRITPAIRILIEHGARVSLEDKQKWLTHINDARTPNERDKLVEVMKLLQPGYKWTDEVMYNERNVPHNAENAISYENIKNGDLMVNINDEMYGPSGVLGEHSHFYKKASWDQWERSQKQLSLPVTSPFTRQVMLSKEVYKAKLLPASVSIEAEAKANANNSTNTSSSASSNTQEAESATTSTKNNNATRTNSTEGGKRRGRKRTRKLKRRAH